MSLRTLALTNVTFGTNGTSTLQDEWGSVLQAVQQSVD